MDKEMIDRVGRAMADYACVNYQHNQAIYDAYAKAAIKAMREPTEKMNLNNAKYDQTSNELWKSMINCIVND